MKPHSARVLAFGHAPMRGMLIWLALIVPLVFTAVATFNEMTETVRETMRRDVRSHATTLGTMLARTERRVELFRRDYVELRREAGLGASGPIEARQTAGILHRLATTTALPSDFVQDGKVLATNHAVPLDPQQPLIAEMLHDVVKANAGIWGFPYLRDGIWMAPYAAPLGDGVIGLASINLTPMQYVFDGIRLPKDFAIGVVTLQARVWFRWPIVPELVGRDVADHQLVHQFRSLRETSSGLAEISAGVFDPRRRLIAWHPVNDTELLTLVGVPKVSILVAWFTSYGVALSLMAVLTAAVGALVARADYLRSLSAAQSAQNERAFQDYAIASGDWFWEQDPEGRLVRISESMRERSGLDPKRLVGLRQEDFRKWLCNPQQSDMETLQAHQARREPYRDMKFEVRMPNGVRWISVSGVPVFEADGRFTGYRVAGQDITERVLAEEMSARELTRVSDRLRLALRAAGIGIWEWRVEEKRLWCDPAMLRLLGKPDASNVQTAFEMRATVHPQDWAALGAARAMTASGRQAGHEVEYRVIATDGSIHYLFESATAEREPGGQVSRTVGAVLDITTRKRLEQAELERAAAESTDRAKSELVSRVSHEFRTPLNAILGFAQLLELDDHLQGSRKAAEYLGAISSAGRHLLALVNDMLDLARLEADRLDLRLRPVPLDEAVGDAAFLTSAQAAQARVSVVIAHETLVGKVVSADPLRLKQVLLNLLSNAVKYSRSGGLVRINSVLTDDGRVSLNISDQGIGIPPDKLDKLFHPFERLEGAALHSEGVGLGLTISRRLVEAMGGTIDVASTVGEGSTFTLSLRADQAPGQDDPATAEPAGDQIEGYAAQMGDALLAIGGQRLRVLYIEDNPLNARLVSAALSDEPDVDLIVADTAGEGIRLAVDQSFDLILLDLNLPDQDGTSAMQQIRAQSRHGATQLIVAVSADMVPGIVQRAMDAGFDEFWSKPIDIRRLKNQLHRRQRQTAPVQRDPGNPAMV